jgi:hypothetical protein
MARLLLEALRAVQRKEKGQQIRLAHLEAQDATKAQPTSQLEEDVVVK